MRIILNINRSLIRSERFEYKKTESRGPERSVTERSKFFSIPIRAQRIRSNLTNERNTMTNIKDTLEERGSKYGPMEQNARLTQELMQAVNRAPGSERLTNMHKETIHMIFFKISRIVNGDQMYVDNVHDIVGYAQLLEEYIETESTQQYATPEFLREKGVSK